jgi:hypothetical protein
MKGRAESKLRGGKGFSRVGQGDGFFNPSLFSGKNIMFGTIMIRNTERVAVQVTANPFNFFQGQTDDTHHGPLGSISHSLEESADGLRNAKALLKGDCFGGCQRGIDSHAVFGQDIRSPPCCPQPVEMDHGKKISCYLKLKVEIAILRSEGEIEEVKS